MTTPERDTLNWPTRRWLLWGLIAILALTAMVLFVIWIGGDGETTPEVGEQMEFSIQLVDMTGDTVTLKGDLPLGYPTETWQNDFQVVRSVAADFGWDLGAELPVAVVDIDNAAGCDALGVELDKWLTEAASGTGEPAFWQSRAFIQHAVNVMRGQDCPIDLSVLEG